MQRTRWYDHMCIRSWRLFGVYMVVIYVLKQWWVWSVSWMETVWTWCVISLFCPLKCNIIYTFQFVCRRKRHKSVLKQDPNSKPCKKVLTVSTNNNRSTRDSCTANIVNSLLTQDKTKWASFFKVKQSLLMDYGCYRHHYYCINAVGLLIWQGVF